MGVVVVGGGYFFVVFGEGLGGGGIVELCVECGGVVDEVGMMGEVF